jgi:Tfp pilus assembly protein PilV
MERKIVHPHRPHPAPQRGFALIVTISLMVLLTIIAVGLLSLSAISLRSGSTSSAHKEAMANARLALLVAIGDLQRAAGPDQRITAPAEMVDENAPRGIVGVWKGYQASAGHISTSKTDPNQFERWLISDADPQRLENPTKVPSVQTPSALLVGDGSLGPKPASNERLEAGIVEVQTSQLSNRNSNNNARSKSGGGYAYAILDESLKARANLDPKPLPFGPVAHQAALGEAQRYGIEAIDKIGTAGFPWWTSAGQDKLITLSTGRLLDNAPPVNEFTYDLTTWSRGLLTDSASGGLRKDLSVMFDDLPTSLTRARVYEDSEAANAPSNPYWKQLAGYANLYKKVKTGDGGYMLTASVPPGYRPYNPRTKAAMPAAFRGGYPAMPAVTKLQMVFSLVARNAHGGWPGQIQNHTHNPKKKYMLHMIYSPIITVYNPYNIPLEFNGLKLTFANIPIGFQFYVNGRAQTSSPAPLNQLYVWKDGDTKQTKEFNIELVSELGSTSSGAAIILQPGESKVFGTSISPDWSWAKDRVGDGNTMFDWRSDKTGKIKLAPGWNTAGVGFDIDWLVPRPIKTANTSYPPGGIVALSSNDRVDVAFQPLSSQASKNKFNATIELKVGRRSYPAGVIEFDYGSSSILSKFLSDRYENDVTFPVRLDRPTVTNRIYEADGTMLKDYKRVKSFAIFSFYNKTTLESGSAAKPCVCHPPTTLITKMNAKRDKPVIHSYEVSLLPVRNAGAGNAGAIEIDPMDRGYSFTGHSLGTGVRVAPIYEAPVLPLQSLAQLRHANLAASGHLPNFTYTVGESWANPLIPKSAVVVPRGAQGYTYLDHTWIANTELWDSSFLSSIASYEGTAFSGSNAKSRSQVLKNFLNGDAPLINSRLSPYLPPGVSASKLATELEKDNDSYRKSAAYIWVEGPFNVNSTSVDAWKTVLASLHKAQVDTYDPLGAEGGNPGNYDDEASPLPRVRRPAGPLISDRSDREERWRGYHGLDDKQIQRLAETIVEEIKDRGPFLSLAEFVNRNPAGSTEQALKGPLQTAIDNSAVNSMFFPDARDIPLKEVSTNGIAFPEAMAGKNAAGAPGYLTQGDILSMLGATPTVRGDTFRIRAYGEARRGGKVIARAWCEAVVQRTHEFVDSADEPSTPVANLTSDANKTFGRRFEIVHFHWLSPEEV